MTDKKLVVNIDLISLYSYFFFTELRPLLSQLEAHGVTVEIVPVFLAGIMAGSKNTPPWMNSAKGAFLTQDTRRCAERLGISFEFPKDFTTFTQDLLPLRVMHAIKARFSPAVYLDAVAAVFAAFWTPPVADINNATVLTDILRAVPALGDAARIVSEAAAGHAAKDALKTATQTAVRQGAFGAPWMVATRADGKEEYFFGSDRLHHIYAFLDVPFTDVALLPAKL